MECTMIQESIIPATATGTYKLSFAAVVLWENISNKTVNRLAKEEIKISRDTKRTLPSSFFAHFLIPGTGLLTRTIQLKIRQHNENTSHDSIIAINPLIVEKIKKYIIALIIMLRMILCIGCISKKTFCLLMSFVTYISGINKPKLEFTKRFKKHNIRKNPATSFTVHSKLQVRFK